jgi:predicted small metal-binding protein
VKSFSCGDVVPGCSRTFTAPDDSGILARVGAHAAADHGLTEVPPALVEQVRARITWVA